jgi:putative peptidoglycan lipid II flippase
MMASVFLSRILGYARDAVIAYQHGATPETDAYFTAFTIPDFLNYLLAGGALSITFIPIFARNIAEGREEDGYRSFSAIATVMGIGMLFFIILGEFLAERLIPLIAPGFPPDQIHIAARITRIVLPAQLFFYLGGLLMAVQYTRNRFLIPATAPLIYNAGIILGGLLLGKTVGMEGFALSDPGLKEFVRLSIPIMLGFSLVVVDEWMTRVFGSFLLAGAITWLNNARRLMQVPVGVFGQASGVASYPFLAALVARGEKEAMWETLSLTLRWVFFVSCAAAAVTCVLSREVVLVVFKRGAFTIEDTLQTAAALAFFSVAIPMWCVQTIVSRGFFALKDTWTPTLVGTGAWLCTLPVYYWLTQRMGVKGLALASTAGISLYAVVLYGILMGRTVGKKGVPEIGEYVKMAAAGVAAAFGGRYALDALVGWASWETFTGALTRFAAGGAAVAIIYYLCALLLRSKTARKIRSRKDLFRPPRGPDAPEHGEPIIPDPGDPPATGA